MSTRTLSCIVLLATSFVSQFNAQVPTAPPQAESAHDTAGDDPLGRSTPRGTVLGFIRAGNRGDYEQAANYLDTRQHGDLAQELARQLQTILDRETSIDLNRVSRLAEGGPANAGKPDRYLVGVAGTSSDKMEIWLDRIQRGDNPPVWLFSETTLEHVPEVYQDLGEIPTIERHLPGWLKVVVFSLPLWRWIVFLVSIPLMLLFGYFLVRLLKWLFTILANRVGWEAGVSRTKGLVAPLRLVLFGLLFLLYGSFSDTLLGRAFWYNLGNALIVFGATWLFMRVFGLLTELTLARLKRNQSFDRIALAGLMGRLAQVGVLTIGILIVLRRAGINLTAALTGLGIGGLAVAFAAQKTLENLFGGIMIISDRPVRIGDSCKVGDVIGNVVDIGLRSTRIRTQDRTIVTIPNGQLAIVSLENYSLRDKFWFHPTIALSQQTTKGQMDTLLRNIRAMLDRHSKVQSETMRVRLIGIRTASLDVEVFAYVMAVDFEKFLGIQEELILEILAIVEATGTELALPTQVTHLVKDPNSQEHESGVSGTALDTHS